MRKNKRATPLSHREFKRDYVATENPRIIMIRKQAEDLAKRIKKEGVQ